jgi:hypothetical protein
MKGQRQQQLLVLWGWRERLCAEKPTTAVAVQFFMSFVPFLSFLFGF